jgi:hypothetical protein
VKPLTPGSKPLLVGRFTPADFGEILLKLPEGCPIIGGQAVVWWAAKYGLDVVSKNQLEPLTSADIDLWGGRDDLIELAKRLSCKAVFPHQYEMTVWVGAIPLSIKGEKTLVEFLHTVPGLDTNDPDRASVEQDYAVPSGRRILQFLSPVSLVLVKLHALRHFDQNDRQDELHLRVSLETSKAFIEQLLRQQAIRELLWNCERLIQAHHLKPYLKLAAQHGFNILGAVPIESIKAASLDSSLDQALRERLANFCGFRWPQATGIRR